MVMKGTSITSTNVIQFVRMGVQMESVSDQILVFVIQVMSETWPNSVFQLAQLVVEMANVNQTVPANVNQDSFWILRRNSAFQFAVPDVSMETVPLQMYVNVIMDLRLMKQMASVNLTVMIVNLDHVLLLESANALMVTNALETNVNLSVLSKCFFLLIF